MSNGETPTEKTSLEQVGEKLRKASERASRFAEKDIGLMRPDPNEDRPIDLEEYADACRTLDCEELFPDSLKKMLISQIDGMTPHQLATRFLPGKKFCLAMFPASEDGNPFDEEDLDAFRHFCLLKVEGRGLTYGYGTPYFYFLLLPKEIQEQCMFEPPKYQYGGFATPKEKDLLKERILTAFDNLKRLLDHKPPKQ